VAGIDLNEIPPAAAPGRITRADVERFAAGQATPGPVKPRATPAARRLAREHGLDLSAIAPSGPRGRVQRGDVLSALDERRPPPAGSPEIDAEVVPLRGIRRAVAERMQASYRTAPHITFSAEVDMTAALALRQQHPSDAPSVSVTAILVKVCAWALRRHRRLNASLREAGIHLHSQVNVGVAVALDDGLIVPVVHGADSLGLEAIAIRLRDLTERARQNRLRPDDVAGGTFTISNLGMFGIDDFTAIINPPESAILAVGRIARRPVVVEQDGADAVVARPVLRLTLSADHRVVDGADAARFMADLRAALERPTLLLM
jgi:pyruvate dehydrogenase E2 component (dihydrolipoamide acetyltransferase)